MAPKPSARVFPVSLVGADDSEQPGSGCALEVELICDRSLTRGLDA